MSGKTLKPFVFIIVILAITGLACQFLSGGSEPAPVQPAVQPPVQEPVQPVQPVQPPPAATQPPAPEPQSPAPTSDYVLFTDRNGLYQIEVPGNWTQSDEVGDSYYIDQFKSPDGNALIENLVYDDGDPFTGKSNGQFALALLHTFYSTTGKEGDIRVSDDKIMPDGSERLTWSSKGGGYSGMSFFEVRNRTTFLMFTVEWGNQAENQYADILNRAIESYVVP